MNPDLDEWTLKERIKRYIILLVGIYFISFGVALFTKSGTGTTAISVIPYTLYLLLPNLTYGTWVALFNMFIVGLETLLLRRDMPLREVIQQLAITAVFGYIVDFSMFLLQGFNPTWYPACLGTCCMGCISCAFGAYLTLISRIGIMAGDGFARAVASLSAKSFGFVRVCSDSTMAAVAAIMSIIAFHALVSVREGTVISALLTGTIVGVFNRYLHSFENVLLPQNHIQDQARESSLKTVPKDNFIITIARQYGSGGREIGHIVADALGVQCYDSRIIAKMADEGGYTSTYVAENEQRLKSSTREEFFKHYAGAVPEQDRPRAEQMFSAENRVIKDLAAQGSCVIVGRLANFVLQKHPHCLNVFVRGDFDACVKHVVERDGLDPHLAAEQVRKVNHERSEYCMFVAHAQWGDMRYYDITVNSSKYGITRTGMILSELAKAAKEAKSSTPHESSHGSCS